LDLGKWRHLANHNKTKMHENTYYI